MTLNTLEREILADAKVALNNRSLKLKDLMEWSSGPIKPRDGELVIRLERLGVNVAVKTEMNKVKP